MFSLSYCKVKCLDVSGCLCMRGCVCANTLHTLTVIMTGIQTICLLFWCQWVIRFHFAFGGYKKGGHGRRQKDWTGSKTAGWLPGGVTEWQLLLLLWKWHTGMQVCRRIFMRSNKVKITFTPGQRFPNCQGAKEGGKREREKKVN